MIGDVIMIGYRLSWCMKQSVNGRDMSMSHFLSQGYDLVTSICLPEKWAFGIHFCWLVWFWNAGHCFSKGNVAKQSAISPANSIHLQPRPDQCILCGQPRLWRWWGSHLQTKWHLILFFSLHPAYIFPIHHAALTFEDLSIMPQKLKGYPVEYLVSYRKGGPSFGSTVSEKMRSSEM